MAEAKNTEMVVLLDFYGELLTPAQRETMEYYYDDDLSLTEIAELTGFTRQGIRDRIKKSEKILSDAEEKLALVAKFRTMQDNVARIVETLERFDRCTPADVDRMIELARACLD